MKVYKSWTLSYKKTKTNWNVAQADISVKTMKQSIVLIEMSALATVNF